MHGLAVGIDAVLKGVEGEGLSIGQEVEGDFHLESLLALASDPAEEPSASIALGHKKMVAQAG